MRDLSAADSLHYSLFKGRGDGHYLASSLHLSAECTLCIYEFIKGPFREFDYNIIECRLEAGICCARNGIFYFIEVITYCKLCSDLSDRIACCLGRKSR